METRRLGNTDLDLTPVGFGTWAIGGGDWGMGWGPQEEKDSIGSILEGLESGINWIDTAHAYGFGLSEEIVGKALREWGQPVIVATKCGVLSNADKTPRRFASRETILEEVENSLRRLQVETIDLYQLHWPEPDENIEEAWQTLLDLQAQGKIRWPGVSNYSASQLGRAAALGPVSSLQPRYSLLNRQIEDEGQMDWCRENNCGIVCYSPMESGLLTGKVTASGLTVCRRTTGAATSRRITRWPPCSARPSSSRSCNWWTNSGRSLSQADTPSRSLPWHGRCAGRRSPRPLSAHGAEARSPRPSAPPSGRLAKRNSTPSKQLSAFFIRPLANQMSRWADQKINSRL